ncbi:hypothetical protein [Kitasatospora sp. NPDC088783]
MLAQLAQLARATGDRRLLDLSPACHPQPPRQIRWTDTVIRTQGRSHPSR